MTIDLKQARDYESQAYRDLCGELGFIPEVRFVKVSTRGHVGFTCGKPDEIRALRQRVRMCGYPMTRGLKTMRL